MTDKSEIVGKESKWTGAIAWVSACILAAGFGSSIPPGLQPIWQRIGAVGLVSSVGLSLAQRGRKATMAHLHRARQNRRVEGRVDRCVSPFDSSDHICEFIDLLMDEMPHPDAATERRAQSDPPRRFRPVTLFPFVSERSTAGIAAAVRNATTHGIGLLHDVAIPPGMASIEFVKGNDVVRGFVDVRWCHKDKHGQYVSGGRLVEAGVNCGTAERSTHPALIDA